MFGYFLNGLFYEKEDKLYRVNVGVWFGLVGVQFLYGFFGV